MILSLTMFSRSLFGEGVDFLCEQLEDFSGFCGIVFFAEICFKAIPEKRKLQDAITLVSANWRGEKAG